MLFKHTAHGSESLGMRSPNTTLQPSSRVHREFKSQHPVRATCGCTLSRSAETAITSQVAVLSVSRTNEIHCVGTIFNLRFAGISETDRGCDSVRAYFPECR